MKNKQTRYISDYYKYKIHAQTNKILNVSFKNLFKAPTNAIEKTVKCQTKKMSYRRCHFYS